MKYVKILSLNLIISIIILFTPVGSLVGIMISRHLSDIDNRFEKNQLTYTDRLQCKLIYQSMVLVGKIIYPEASQILQHYLKGNGKDLYLEAGYFKRSPVVLKNLNSMETNESKVVRFHQQEDWRLSYSLNPFHLKKGRKKINIYQKIKFRSEKGVYTNLNLYSIKIRLPERLIHTLKPKPYMVYVHWK